MLAKVNQADEPCTLHKVHTPPTVINEGHHIFPEYLQARVWGETRDKRKQVICATTHNSVHHAIDTFLRHGVWPKEVRGSARALAKLGIQRYNEALAAKGE